jgi:ABC-type lipoprotein release transport system permease subunit
MNIVLLAFRNIVRNKKNSLIIVLLIALITFLFFTGNSLIGRSEKSLRESFVESLTGDVVIQKTGEVTMNLFGANTPVIDEYFTVPVLPAFDLVMEIAAAEPGVAGITSQVSGKAYLDILGVREAALLAGVDPEGYFPLFEGIRLEEGSYITNGEYGAMITSGRADRIAARTGERPRPGTPLLFTAGGEAGFKIREVPLTGIFSYRNPGQFMNEVILTDPQTVRLLSSIQTAAPEFDTGAEADDLLGLSPDDLFGFSGDAEVDNALMDAEDGAGGFSAEALESFLGFSDEKDDAPLSGGNWNFIIIKLKDGVSHARVIRSLNRKLAPFDVTAVNWRMAAGTSAILVLLVQALFNAGVFLVSAAGIIAAVNILLISVFKRTREIGTLRAIGAEDAYIRGLVLSENGILSFAAAALGIACGCLFIRLVNSLRVVIPNPLIASLLGGGPALTLVFLPGTAIFSFALALVIGFAASVFPVETAVRIDPITAVRQG